jgi:hypothetical protein
MQIIITFVQCTTMLRAVPNPMEMVFCRAASASSTCIEVLQGASRSWGLGCSE